MAEAYKYSYFAVSIPEEFILHIGIRIYNVRSQKNSIDRNPWTPSISSTSLSILANNRQIRQTASVFKQATSDPNVRAIILSARGKAFSAGLDRTTPLLMS